MTKKIAIVQSNYIPWKGYFDLIAYVDEFIIYDEMQYTKRDWRNRNKIKTPTGSQWITVPVFTKGKFSQKISETTITDSKWQRKHWHSLEKNYSSAPYFEEISIWLKPLYFDTDYEYISVLNKSFIVSICLYLGIKTQISSSSDYKMLGDKSERLANICLQTDCSEYISGPAAKHYIDSDVFAQNNIQLTWFEYPNYAEYNQLWR